MRLWPTIRRLALLAANGTLAVLLWHALTLPQGMPEERVSATRSITIEPTVALPGRQAPENAALPARDLFASADPPPAPAPAPPATPVPAPAIVLIGTALGDTNFALVRLSPEAPASRFKEGAVIGDWLLATVRRNAIIVVRDQSRWRIGFAPAQPVQCATPACAD